MVNKFLKRLYTFLIYLFLYAPILILIIFSFNNSRSRGNWGGFSLKWYSALFKDSQIMTSLYYTLTVALISAAIATLLGTAAAIGIHNMKRKQKKIAMNITYLPVLNADIVTGVALMILFISIKLPLGFVTMLLAHITFEIPYVILSVLPKLKQLNNNIYEAALDLGAEPWYAFRKVIFPEIMPGIISGALLAFTLSLDDFVISFFTTGSGVSNLSITIYSMARRGINPKINALSTLLFLTVLLLLLAVNRRTSKTAETKSRKKQSKRGFALKITAAVLPILMIIALTGYKRGTEKVTLNVYNWGDYIDETVISEFEDTYNIKVNYENFATNEDMYVKIKSGGTNYDVAFPSDYMISKMIKERLLEKIDLNNIPNYSLIDNNFKNLKYDINNEYSVPYMWGTVGIIYNKKMVKEPVESWNILWDKKYKKQILMLDSQRESIGVALQKLGYSLNTRNKEELEAAKRELIRQKPLVLAYVGDEIKDKMIAGEAALAVAWAGDAVFMKEQNPDLEYIVPKEGSNIFFDAMVIPKTSKHKKEAEMFINFMCETDVALKNTEYIGYSTPQIEAKNSLPMEIANDPVAYPDAKVIKRCEVYEDLTDMIKEYDRIWTEVKAAR